MKELGVVIYNCSSLAKDLRKIFQSYWVMGQPNSSLPQPWPAHYNTDINKQHPLLVKENNISTRLYVAVSSLGFSSFLKDTVRFSLSLIEKGLYSAAMSTKTYLKPVVMNQVLLLISCVSLQASPPSFCPPSRTQDLDAILSIIYGAQHYVDVAVMEYFPTTRFDRPRRLT